MLDGGVTWWYLTDRSVAIMSGPRASVNFFRTDAAIRACRNGLPIRRDFLHSRRQPDEKLD